MEGLVCQWGTPAIRGQRKPRALAMSHVFRGSYGDPIQVCVGMVSYAFSVERIVPALPNSAGADRAPCPDRVGCLAGLRVELPSPLFEILAVWADRPIGALLGSLISQVACRYQRVLPVHQLANFHPETPEAKNGISAQMTCVIAAPGPSRQAIKSSLQMGHPEADGGRVSRLPRPSPSSREVAPAFGEVCCHLVKPTPIDEQRP
jgi:hypothetical protein